MEDTDVHRTKRGPSNGPRSDFELISRILGNDDGEYYTVFK